MALKISSPDILHKIDVGGAVLGCASMEEVRLAFNQSAVSVKEKAPGARVQDVSVEEMVREGVEVILGVTRDPRFGLTMMFGLGGVFVEVRKDVSFWVLPITREDACQIIGVIKGRALLETAKAAAPHKPILCGAMGGPYTEQISRAIQEQGVPVYHTVREWVAAARALVPGAAV